MFAGCSNYRLTNKIAVLRNDRTVQCLNYGSKTNDLAWSCFCIVHFFTLIHTIIIIIGPSPAFVPTTVLDLWSRDPDQDARHFVRSNAQHAGIK